MDIWSQFSNIWSLNPKAATEPSNQRWVDQWIMATELDTVFLTPWTCVWELEKKGHSTLLQKIAYRPAIHHPNAPHKVAFFPTQQWVDLGSAPCHCVWRRRLVLRNLVVDWQNQLSKKNRGPQSQGHQRALTVKSQLSWSMNHSTLPQKMAYKPAIHHPIIPLPPLDMPPARWLGPKGWAEHLATVSGGEAG